MDSTNPNNALPECPEGERLLAIRDKSQAIGEFLEWLQFEKQMIIGAYDHSEWCERYKDDNDNSDCNCNKADIYPVNISVERLLAEYFEIDLDKVEREKRRLLAKLQVINQL